MSKGLEALNKLVSHIETEYHSDDYYECKNAKDTIEKELKRLEELEKAFVALSKDDEKAKKELSKEIEKNRALEIIKDKNVAITMIKQTQSVEEYNMFAYDFLQIKRVDEDKYKLSPQPLAKEEWDLVRKALL